MSAVRVLFGCLFMVSTLTACTSMRQSDSRAITLEMKGKPGTTTETRYFSNSRTLAYQDGQLLRDRIEAVDFSVRTTVKSYDPATGQLMFKIKTVRKDGKVELHDLAFPELNEEIEYIINGKTGVVTKAGAYSPQSLFFVPAMPLPKGEVQVGDTWAMKHAWYSAGEGIPLELDIIGILKAIVPCEGTGTCADIELSGGVELLKQPTTANSAFQSKLWGRMLFSLDRGDVIWSEMRSKEGMSVPGERVEITSCMLSETKLKHDYSIGFECDPKEQPVSKAPNL